MSVLVEAREPKCSMQKVGACHLSIYISEHFLALLFAAAVIAAVACSMHWFAAGQRDYQGYGYRCLKSQRTNRSDVNCPCNQRLLITWAWRFKALVITAH